MRIDGRRFPNITLPSHIPQAAPAAASAAAGIQGAGTSGSGRALGGDELAGMVPLARNATYADGRLERGARLGGAAGSTASGQDAAGRMPSGVVVLGPQGQRDIGTMHPLYGRYLGSWQSSGGAARPGEALVQMLQDRLTELKAAVRALRHD